MPSGPEGPLGILLAPKDFRLFIELLRSHRDDIGSHQIPPDRPLDSDFDYILWKNSAQTV